MHLPDPTFPPLITGCKVSAPDTPAGVALKKLSESGAEAGDLFWASDVDAMRFALVLEPDVPRQRCHEMVYLGMVSFSDALGSVAPPEVAITFLWPSMILVNGAIVGHVDLLVSDADDEGVPHWMVFSIEVDLRPKNDVLDPGNELSRTTLFLEGCGDIDRTQLTESTARHMVNWTYTWSEDGFSPVHREWEGRYHRDDKLGALRQEVRAYETLGGAFLSLDEHGNALIKDGDGTTQLVTTAGALAQRRGQA